MKQKQFLAIDPADFHDYSSASVVILPAPYEHTSSYGLGSSKGPQAIIEASHFVEYYDEELDIETIQHLNIFTENEIDFGDLINEGALQKIEEATTRILSDNKFPVVLGGEHTCTLGVFKAIHSNFEDVSILQLDAHADLRKEYEGNKFSHASVMARINEMGVHIAQLGVRALSIEEAQEIEQNERIKTVFGHEVDTADWADEILSHLTDNVFITIDADGFDPSIIPGTGTPEPGGLQWYPTLRFLRRVFEEKNVVGFDIVECSPREGETISEFNLAKLLYKLLGFRYLNQNLQN